MAIVAFGSNVINIFEVNDMLSYERWHLNLLQIPNRHTITAVISFNRSSG